jgi:outer membrane protein
MSLKVSNIIRKLIFTGSLFWAVSAQAQQDSLFLSVEQLFESGIKSSLQLQSDSLKEWLMNGNCMPKPACFLIWK